VVPPLPLGLPVVPASPDTDVPAAPVVPADPVLPPLPAPLVPATGLPAVPPPVPGVPPGGSLAGMHPTAANAMQKTVSRRASIRERIASRSSRIGTI
jgi:hypothetical protein